MTARFVFFALFVASLAFCAAIVMGPQMPVRTEIAR